MRIVVGADHAGYELKAPIVAQLESLGHTHLDVGTHNHDPVDYPDLARQVAEAVLNDFGASAPGPVLMEKFGFTTANIVARASALLR